MRPIGLVGLGRRRAAELNLVPKHQKPKTANKHKSRKNKPSWFYLLKEIELDAPGTTPAVRCGGCAPTTADELHA